MQAITLQANLDPMQRQAVMTALRSEYPALATIRTQAINDKGRFRLCAVGGALPATLTADAVWAVVLRLAPQALEVKWPRQQAGWVPNRRDSFVPVRKVRR